MGIESGIHKFLEENGTGYYFIRLKPEYAYYPPPGQGLVHTPGHINRQISTFISGSFNGNFMYEKFKLKIFGKHEVEIPYVAVLTIQK